MVSEGTATTHASRFAVEPVSTCNGASIAPLVEGEGPEIEVINLHVTRSKLTPEWMERHSLKDLPRTERVVVETPDGVACTVDVRLMVLEGYLYAAGHQSGVCRGEDPFRGGEFPRKCELLAERIALQIVWLRG